MFHMCTALCSTPYTFSTGHQLQDMKIDDLVRLHVALVSFHDTVLGFVQDTQVFTAHLALLHTLGLFETGTRFLTVNVVGPHVRMSLPRNQGLHVAVTGNNSIVSDLCPVGGSCLQHYKNRRYSSYGSYGTSKLANVLFAKELARRCGMPL